MNVTSEELDKLEELANEANCGYMDRKLKVVPTGFHGWKASVWAEGDYNPVAENMTRYDAEYFAFITPSLAKRMINRIRELEKS